MSGMQTYSVTVSNGDRIDLEGPPGLTDDQVRAYVSTELAKQGKPYANAPNTINPPQRFEDPEDSLLSDVAEGVGALGAGALEGAAGVWDKAADWTQAALNVFGGAGDALAGGRENNVAGMVPETDAAFEGVRGVGRFAGEAAATAPLGALRIGTGAVRAGIQGGVGGALLSGPQSDLFDLGVNTLAGAAGGAAGAGLLGGAARIAQPDPVAPELRTLINAGVRVEPGQVARSAGTREGGRFARWVDKSTSGGFVGEAVTRARQDGFEDFARATINRAVEPIGAALPAGMPPGRAAVRWAGDQLSNAYDALLPQLSVSGDQGFIDDLATIHADAQTLAPARTQQFNAVLNDLGRFWQNDQTLTGDALKAVETRLSARIRRLSASPDADQQDLGDAFEAVRDAMNAAAARQNPAQAGELQAINRGWKGLVQVERASANSKARITPAGYSQAVKQSSDTVRRRGYARGEALNQDLSDAASDILPSEYPDSGTAGRWQQMNTLAVGKGALDLARYRAAQIAQPLYLRQTNLHPNLARLLQYGAAGAPQLATAGVAEARR